MTSPIQQNRIRAGVFAVLALAMAAGTGWLAWRTVNAYEARLDQAKVVAGARAVVVATRDLRAGVALTAEDIKVVQRDLGGDPGQIFESTDALIGKVVGDRVLVGEPIRAERLVVGGAMPLINEIVDHGARAFTVRANRAAAVGGLLQPGFYVDVIVTIRPGNDMLTADWVTDTILQGVRILAVGESVSVSPVDESPSKGDEKESQRQAARDIWVTLEVEPEEAQQLALASSRGQIHLALRARDDFGMLAASKPLVTNALVGLTPPVQKAQERRLERKRELVKAAPAPASPSPPAHITDEIRGTQRTIGLYDEKGNPIPPAPARRP